MPPDMSSLAAHARGYYAGRLDAALESNPFSDDTREYAWWYIGYWLGDKDRHR
jgi:hypothetical protein